MTYLCLSLLEPHGLVFQCSIVKSRVRKKLHFSKKKVRACWCCRWKQDKEAHRPQMYYEPQVQNISSVQEADAYGQFLMSAMELIQQSKVSISQGWCYFSLLFLRARDSEGNVKLNKWLPLPQTNKHHNYFFYKNSTLLTRQNSGWPWISVEKWKCRGKPFPIVSYSEGFLVVLPTTSMGSTC